MDTKNRLKQLREENNISQMCLAKYLNTECSKIEEYEVTGEGLTLSQIEQICCLFGCDAAFLTGSDIQSELNTFKPYEVNKSDFKAITAINKIVMNINYMNELINS